VRPADGKPASSPAPAGSAPLPLSFKAHWIAPWIADVLVPPAAEPGDEVGPVNLPLPPGWGNMHGWASETPHQPSWCCDEDACGCLPEQERDELLLKAEVSYFFALALDGNDRETRERRRNLLFRAEKNFFFAQGLPVLERPEFFDEEDDEGWEPEPPAEAAAEAAAAAEPGRKGFFSFGDDLSGRAKEDAAKPAAPVPEAKEEVKPGSGPDADRKRRAAAAERDRKRRAAAAALSYETLGESAVVSGPGKTPRGASPSVGGAPIAPGGLASVGGGGSKPWWEDNRSTAPRRVNLFGSPF
jgi:hypothetical protein